MSDTVIVSLITGFVTLISAGLTGYVTIKLSKIKSQVDVVENKLDESHKQMNGNLTKLLQTTADLATAKEKAKGIEENKSQ